MAAPWNVLNDQQDSMSVRDAGWVQLYCRDNQEILDTTLQAYRIAERLNVPVMVCYDGFFLSHTVMPVDVPSAGEIAGFLPPRTDPLQLVDVNDPRNIGPVTLADPRADADGVVRPGYMEFRALHHGALLEGKRLAVVFDKALSYGYEGPIAADLKAALQAAEESPAVFGCICGLGGRDVSPEDLVAATRRAIDGLDSGVRDREPDWINLRPEGDAR